MLYYLNANKKNKIIHITKEEIMFFQSIFIYTYGKLAYAGITHIHQLIQKLKKTQNLSSPYLKT